MEQLRVLHVFGGLDSGGAESRTMDIYRQIDKSKVQFDFLIHTQNKGVFEDEINELGGRIYRVPRFGLKTIFLYKKVVNDFFKSHPEYKIIHGHMLSTAFIYQKLAKKNGIPVRIGHSRSGTRAQVTLVNIIKELTEKMSRFHLTDMFAVSKVAGYSAFGNRKVDDGEVKIIPNAINAKKFVYNEKTRKSLRYRLGFDKEFVICHIGRFTSQKNHIFMLEIFHKIQKNIPGSMLILVGDGQLKLQIEKKIQELNLQDKVRLLGVRKDVPEILQAMDMLLFPSTHEGLPGVVLEAQAAGLPCVISDRITDEVKITNLVKYISLNKNADYWADEVIKHSVEVKRRDTYSEISRAGFDIETVSKWYQQYYLNSIDGKN